jgi:hypothetical protein
MTRVYTTYQSLEQDQKNNGRVGGENGHQASLDGDYCCNVVCTSMGTGGWEERQGGGLKYYWEDGELWGLEAIFDGCTKFTVFSNYIQLTFIWDTVSAHYPLSSQPPGPFHILIVKSRHSHICFQNFVRIETRPPLSISTHQLFSTACLARDIFHASTPFNVLALADQF